MRLLRFARNDAEISRLSRGFSRGFALGSRLDISEHPPDHHQHRAGRQVGEPRRQVDIGFSQAPFNLNAVEEGRIRIIAMGRDVPELRQMTSRLIIANTAILAEKKPLIARYMQGFVETLDWLYSDPAAIKAYAAWSGLPEGIAKRAPEFLTKQNLDPRHISGLDAIVADAVKFKYLPAPLSAAQLAEVIQVPVK